MPELNFVSHDPSEEIIPTCWLCKGKAFILLKKLYEHNKIKTFIHLGPATAPQQGPF